MSSPPAMSCPQQEIQIASCKSKKRDFGNAFVLDVTSKSDSELGQLFSPFYPHGGIPVHGFPQETSESVEGVWQALKIIDGKTDFSKLTIKTMKKIKRSSRNKTISGHATGGYGESQHVLNYLDARKQIYIPTYEWMLENRMKKDALELKQHKKLVLLDYDVNEDVHDLKKPLSHASVLKRWLLNHE
jgi:hypothetical protein